MEPVIIKVGYLVQAGGGNLPAGTEGQFLGYGAGGVPVAIDAPAGVGYDDTELSARVDGAQADATAALDQIAALPAPYDDTAMSDRVTDVEADVVTAQSRADAAYSLAQQGGGTGAYDDTEVRGLIGAVDDKADANAAAIAAIGPTAWDDVTEKPATFPPATHTHSISQITSLQATLTTLAEAIDGNTDALAGKQDAVSIKTINGESIVGTGDIVIPTYNDTAVQDLIAGLEARIAALEGGTPSEPETAPTLTGGSLTVA